MSHDPDFEALRARRNEAVRERNQRIADEEGVPLQSLRSTFNPEACYCACSTGGPCEHSFSGWHDLGDGLFSQVCSRCGASAFSHSLRTVP
jgi:hypothetical protein